MFTPEELEKMKASGATGRAMAAAMESGLYAQMRQTIKNISQTEGLTHFDAVDAVFGLALTECISSCPPTPSGLMATAAMRTHLMRQVDKVATAHGMNLMKHMTAGEPAAQPGETP